MKYRISANVIKRLPRYIRTLDSLQRDGTEKISSSDLSGRLGLTASQIRQDFNCFGGFGHQGYGYNVAQLKKGIRDVLGVEELLTAALVGAGNLGRALMANFNFSECGVKLMAAFDTNPEKIGCFVGGVEIMDAAELPRFLKDSAPDIIILTLPKDYADEMVALAEKFNVRGIWNFTGTDIESGLQVVEDVHLSDSLLTLGYYLRSSQNDDRERKLR